MNDYGSSNVGDFGRVTFGVQQVMTKRPAPPIKVAPINPYAPLPGSDTATVEAKDGRWKGYRVVPRKEVGLCAASMMVACERTYYDMEGYLHAKVTKGGKVISDKYVHRKEPVVITAPVPALVPAPVPALVPVVEIEKEKELIEAGVRIDPKWIKVGVVIGITGLLLAILSRRR